MNSCANRACARRRRRASSFLYRDFRPLHEQSHEAARRRQLYLQPYCGCCFSEYERFRDTTRELYRGSGRRGMSAECKVQSAKCKVQSE